jgi:hypothetical protein
VRGHALQGGDIVVIQTHGRHGQSHPHVPIIAPRGGWERQARQWMPLDDIPSALLRKKGPW